MNLLHSHRDPPHIHCLQKPTVFICSTVSFSQSLRSAVHIGPAAADVRSTEDCAAVRERNEEDPYRQTTRHHTQLCEQSPEKVSPSMEYRFGSRVDVGMQVYETLQF